MKNRLNVMSSLLYRMGVTFFYGICLLLPTLAFAETTGNPLSFTPPPSDLSVVFLGNIFGVVDGVLHGSGSQIMGAIFGIFNSAVLALGGIILIYTILVATLNTAQEGEMLGKKFNTIWVPIRTTLGLALLLPKASGYCVMQIFVMWLVVQGVGAADRIWETALSYLQRGGVIVQANIDSSTSATADNSSIAKGAGVILGGTVCMAALETQLENIKKNYQDQGKCTENGANYDSNADVQTLCKNEIPDFLDSVDILGVETLAGASETQRSVEMPAFDSDSAFVFLNGICGTIAWNALVVEEDDLSGLSAD